MGLKTTDAMREHFKVGLGANADGRTPVIISLVIPVFNEEEAIPSFIRRVRAISNACANGLGRAVQFEYVFVNDGSEDSTLDVLVQQQAINNCISIVNLSRNFGKEAALTAGLDYASGDVVIPIDVDLQDPPELIPEMLVAWSQGNEVVLAKRISRIDESWLKRNTAELFYKFHNLISRTKIPENVGDFRLMDRRVVNALKQLPENRRFMKGLFAWVGFRTATVEYNRPVRTQGHTKFSGWSLWRLAMEGITNFSSALLAVWLYTGFAVAAASFVMAIVITTQKILWGIPIVGYALLTTSVFFLGGIQLIGIGILGEYIGRIFSEVKRRPVYLVKDIYMGSSDEAD